MTQRRGAKLTVVRSDRDVSSQTIVNPISLSLSLSLCLSNEFRALPVVFVQAVLLLLLLPTVSGYRSDQTLLTSVRPTPTNPEASSVAPFFFFLFFFFPSLFFFPSFRFSFSFKRVGDVRRKAQSS